MATKPILRVRLNNGDWQRGAVTAQGGDEVSLSLESPGGFGTKRWEIYSSPPGFGCPSGWSIDAGNTAIYYFVGDSPPMFPLPLVASGEGWGKWLLRVMCDGDGTKIDDSTGVQTLSPNELHDIAPLETTQFGGPYKGWSGFLQLALRKIDAALSAGGGGGGSSSPSEWVFSLSGVYDQAVLPGWVDPPRRALTPRTISRVELLRRTAGSSGKTRVDVKKNGTSIFASSATQPQVTSDVGDYAMSSVISFAGGAAMMNSGDRLELSLEEVETYKGGPVEGPEGFTVTIYFTN